MMCEKCELEHGSSDNEFFTNCHNCGRRMYADDAYAVENEIWCQYCIDNHAHVCECCHEYIIEE